MELFIVIYLTIVLLFGLKLPFKSDRITIQVQQFDRNSSNLWNFGLDDMNTIGLITYEARE